MPIELTADEFQTKVRQANYMASLVRPLNQDEASELLSILTCRTRDHKISFACLMANESMDLAYGLIRALKDTGQTLTAAQQTRWKALMEHIRGFNNPTTSSLRGSRPELEVLSEEIALGSEVQNAERQRLYELAQQEGETAFASA